jgi:hypothetical protein
MVPPAASVIVNVVFTGSELIPEMGTEAERLPLPMPPVKFDVPVIVKPVAPRTAVALTVNVVLIVAAGAMAHASRAEARTAESRVIIILKSPPL